MPEVAYPTVVLPLALESLQVEAVNADKDNNADRVRALDMNMIYFLIICVKHGG